MIGLNYSLIQKVHWFVKKWKEKKKIKIKVIKDYNYETYARDFND